MIKKLNASQKLSSVHYVFSLVQNIATYPGLQMYTNTLEMNISDRNLMVKIYQAFDGFNHRNLAQEYRLTSQQIYSIIEKQKKIRL